MGLAPGCSPGSPGRESAPASCPDAYAFIPIVDLICRERWIAASLVTLFLIFAISREVCEVQFCYKWSIWFDGRDISTALLIFICIAYALYCYFY